MLFYHSACKEPAVAGLAVVTREGYPDFFAFDPDSKYFDAKSKEDKPTWFMVDETGRKIRLPVTLSELREQRD